MFAEQLESLYRRVPKITNRCPEGCTICCGLLPWSKFEADRVYEKVGRYPAIDKNGSCIFVNEYGCSIYEYRPFMCRIYGHGLASSMHCEKVINSKGMKPEKLYLLMNEYQLWIKLFDKLYIPKEITD